MHVEIAACLQVPEQQYNTFRHHFYKQGTVHDTLHVAASAMSDACVLVVPHPGSSDSTNTLLLLSDRP